MIDYHHYKSILCLNGDLPEAAFFINISLPIIAADGAANKLVKIGIKPQMVIGDLDSLHEEHKDKLPLHFHYDQNYCDFEKSLAYLAQQHLLPTIIVGVNGGCLDHVLNNINHFIDTNNLIYAPPVYGLTIKEQTIKTFSLSFNTKLSLFGIPHAKVTTEGLKWNLKKSLLTFPGKNSCFNRSTHEEVTITVHEGSVIVFIYLS